MQRAETYLAVWINILVILVVAADGWAGKRGWDLYHNALGEGRGLGSIT